MNARDLNKEELDRIKAEILAQNYAGKLPPEPDEPLKWQRSEWEKRKKARKTANKSRTRNR